MSKPVRVLCIEPNQHDRDRIRRVLERENGGFELIAASSRREFEMHLADLSFDVVLSEFNIPGLDGLSVLNAVRAVDPSLPVIMITLSGPETFAELWNRCK